MSFTYVTPTTITGLSNGWNNDVDLSGFGVGANAVFVGLRFINSNASRRGVGCRHPDYTVARINDIKENSMEHGFSGVSSQTTDIYVENASDVAVEVVMYMEGEATYDTNDGGQALTLGTQTSTWQTESLAAKTGGETGLLAIVEFTSGGVRTFGCGKGGLGSSNPTPRARAYHWWYLIPMDGTEQIDYYTDATTTGYLIGWVTAGFTSISPTDRAANTVSAWTDISVSQAGVGRLFYAENGNTTYTVGLRPKSGSDTTVNVLNTQGNCLPVGVDGSGDCQYNVSNAGMDLWEVGYFSTVATGAVDSDFDFDRTLPATKKLRIYNHWTEAVGNGNTVPFDVLIDDVSKDTGSIDQTAAPSGRVIDGFEMELVSTLTDQAAGTLTYRLNNTNSGGKVVADAMAIEYAPANAVYADWFDGGAVAYTAHTPDYHEHGGTRRSSGATILADNTGVQFAASQDYFTFPAGTVNHGVVWLWYPGADNRMACYMRANNAASDNITGYKVTLRTGTNQVQLAKLEKGTSTILVAADVTLSTSVTHEVDQWIEGSDIFVKVNGNLLISHTDTSILTGGDVWFRHETWTDNTGRLRKAYVYTDDAVDSTAPGQVVGQDGTVRSDTRVDLTWTALTGASEYIIYQDAVEIARTAGTLYSVTDLTAATAYAFTISGIDAVGNKGTVSAAVNKTTDAVVDSTAPATPTGLRVTSIDSSDDPLIVYTIAWDANVEADLWQYRIYIDSILDTYYTVLSGTETLTIETEDVSIAIQISAEDFSGNESSLSAIIMASSSILSTISRRRIEGST